MTVSTTSSRVTQQGNNATTVFPFSFKIPDAASLVVQLANLTTGVITTLNNTQYSVTGLGTNSGSVTYPLVGSPIDTNTSITISRSVGLTQLTDLTNQDGFFPDVLEAAFDKLTYIAQQIVDAVGRQLKLRSSDVDGSGAYDANGNRVTNLGAPALSSDAVRLSDLQAAQIVAGNVPNPTAPQTGYFLRATGAAAWAWTAFTASMISNASAAGQAFLTAADLAAQKTLLGLAAMAFKANVAISDHANFSAASKLLGAGSSGGTPAEIALGSKLAMTSNTLDVTGVVATGAFGIAVAAAKWAATTGVIAKSTGVTSVVRNSAGNYTITLASAQPDTDYIVVGGAGHTSLTRETYSVYNRTTTTFLVNTDNGASTVDFTDVWFILFRPN